MTTEAGGFSGSRHFRKGDLGMGNTEGSYGRGQGSPHFLSGQEIAQMLIASGEDFLGKLGPVPVARDGMSEDEKRRLNEQLRAERFGIGGAIIWEFASAVLTTDSDGDRPTFNFAIQSRPLEARASKKKVIFTDAMLQDREALNEQFGDHLPDSPGIYIMWQPYSNATIFDDIQNDARVVLDNQLKDWAEDQKTGDTKVWKWAQHLVEVSRVQKVLGVKEAILTEIDGEIRNKEMTGGTVAASTPMEAIERLPIENIVNIHGELVQVALELLDRCDMDDETTRLRVIDDIALQTYDISTHHIARFANGEATDASDASRIMKLNPSLHQNGDGRWTLDWTGRVKPAPKGKVFSRTQRCPAGYQADDELKDVSEVLPNPLHSLCLAFNTELKNRGLLVPGVSKQPPPTIELPASKRVRILYYGET